MHSIKRSALVPYSTSEMYNLVADIGAYGEFLPWCSTSDVISADEDEVVAAIGIEYSGMSKKFTTRNRLQKNKMMEMRLLEGPFSHLHGYWQFHSLDESASKIMLDLEFSFKSRMAGAVIGPVFNRIADNLVEAFTRRAEQRYGKR